ncbi:M20/M25/M40 family metallo-hydrolase [Aquincola sp. MAHUQ-54]|uniref:M20/M25/M40 family metallo-hydrolase n=1 Tax=Aquincola agrisoli TaxID=3119538 RepID=A0AAW9QEG3_9BURK
MKKLLSGFAVLPLCIPAVAAPPVQTYTPTVTAAERAAVHAKVEALAGDVGNTIVGDGRYNPLSLVGAMLDGGKYDSISRGAGGQAVSTAYPFPVNSNANNQNERERKTAKLNWLVDLAKSHGFPVVVRRQADKYVYVEIGDPDAPEMIMALSHLDSPTASVSAAQLERWRGADGLLGTASSYYPDSYHTPYVKDGWIYGAGIQDDSGPTLATMLAAKALMEAGLPRDRRIRIVMGIYEDGGPGTPTVANTANFMSIPYYTANPSFYDNWAYKMLNREEMPIAAYTSDSRFPVIVGNSVASTPTVSMDLSSDAGKPFSLVSAVAGVTLRAGDPTLKDITYGSTTQVASRAVFTLNAAGVSASSRSSFISGITAAATAQRWLTGLPTETPKVRTEIAGDTIILEINTGVAMEMPTPHYGKNAIVWGMHLLSQALGANGITASDLQLKKAADGLADLFFRGGVEGEAYIGRYMGIPDNLLRNIDNGAPNLTFALMGGINSENLASFYTGGSLSIPMFMRSMHKNATDYNAAITAVTGAWQGKGFTLGTIAAFANPTLYMTHDNPLIALQLASYRGTMNHDPAAFSDVYGLLDLTYAQGTTGGTLASNFRNKMNAFGAVIPGNERWWHTANERMKVASAVQMTKMMADGMLEMARYSGPAGAQYMWADIPGLNADRADLDLLDVTIGTYKDASAAVLPQYLGTDKKLAAATSFRIPMWNGRGNTTVSAAAYALGHEAGGVYLPLNDSDFLANTFVLPMRLEFKVNKPANLNAAQWKALVTGTFKNFSFNALKGGSVVPLVAPDAANADKFFYKRVSATDPNSLYVSVNLAVTDAPYQGVSTVIADSKTDLYSVNPNYLASNANPFPERGAKKQRGFFLFGDGSKDAEFASPDAIYVTFKTPGDVNGDGVANCSDLALTKATFNKRQGQAGFDARADFDGNGAVDIKDWSLMTSIVPVPSCPQ